ncbi:DUF2784 domain-containing protein [Trinickia sp. EG282A]|uniref:DUF2784 domain-containing protein n=1 Tax=Trinickia sp. EG282A TaxID=3237013 RepID=UPI0034D2CC15
MTAWADIVLILHALVVSFIVGGFAAIWVGVALGWQWVRNPVFRLLHLGAIGIVALLAVADIPCPLTVLETWLRHGATSNQGFVEYWLQRLIYYDFPPWVFTVAYSLFALLVLCTWRFVPPRRRR